MADIDIVVDSSDLKVAIDLANQYGVNFTKMVNQVQTESNRLARASKASSNQITEAYRRMEAVVSSNQAEAALAEKQRKRANVERLLAEHAKVRAEREKQAAIATKELERETSALIAKYNPLLAAEKQYLVMIDEISRARELGVLDAKQEAAALKQLEKEYQALSKGVYLAGSRFNQFGEQAGIAGKNANRFGMYAQQAGYQLGDFAVQVQSGTNVGVAFSQQFAQLAGLIPGVAGAVTTFAAIGLGLLIQNLTRGKEEAAKLDDVVSDFEKFDDIFKSAGASFQGNFNHAIDSVRANYGDFVADLTSSSTSGALKRLTAAMDTNFRRGALYDPQGDAGWLTRQTNTLKFAGANALAGFGVGGADYLEELSSKRAEYLSAIEGLDEKIKQLGESGFFTSKQLAEGFVDFYQNLSDSGNMTDDLLSRLRNLADEAGISELVAQTINQREQEKKAAESMLQTLEQEIRMRDLILRYGEDSVQVKQAELDAEYAKTEATIKALDVSESLRLEIEAAAKANYDAESATIAWGNSLGYVKNQIAGIASILASIGGGMISNAEKFTTAKLIREGKSRVEAEKLARYQTEDARYEAQKQQNLAQYGKIIGSAINAGLSLQRDGERNADEALLSAYELDAERAKAEREANKKGRKKGGRGKLSDAEKDAKKAAEKLEDFFDQFKLGMEQQERLLGVYGEQREELEKVIEIENRLGEARHLVSQKQIEAMANEELALERRLQRGQELYDLGNQNVENLLMTIVSGTSSIEDAFKAMLASIISEIYQNYVAKGAADVAGNFLVSLFSANGNAFGVGGVKMFAKGGVVDSPTLFNYSGGTGMMGEAGPEAILPLKRNSQGKLGVEVSGNSQSVVVNNNWHIAANGDAAVKAIIQAETPRIVETTKLAVADANRRNRRGFK